MSASSQTVLLKDYRPPVFLTKEIHLEFQLDEESTTLVTRQKFQRNPKSEDNDISLFLNGEELDLKSIALNGNDLDKGSFTTTSDGLTVLDCPDQFELTTRVELIPQNNKAFSGLYKTKSVFCTQMEAEGFRRMTYVQDRPDVLSTYTVTIEADSKKYPILLSNGNFVSEEQVGSDRKKATWHDPHPKPTYLFALVAGDLDWIEDSFQTRSNRSVALKIFVNKGKSALARYAMDSLKLAMKWDEDTYRLEYDLDIYNIVAVDDFNMGAMENKGLNIFNSKYVLASPQTATDKDYDSILQIIGHEYFHNWTGNRVTCRDWFQLSLKEGLTVFRDQEFGCDMGSRSVMRIQDVIRLRQHQFPQDSGPMAHPVRPESYMAIDNFYTVTIYEKGAEVIRMLQHLLGEEMFKKGVAKYFELFDGQAVTTDDWIFAMEEVSGRDLDQFKNWYRQAGTPTVSVQYQYDENQKRIVLELQQECPHPITKVAQSPFVIPLKLGLISKNGTALEFSLPSGESTKETTIELNQISQSFVFHNVYEAPVLSINRDFTAPIHLKVEQSDDAALLMLTSDTDPFNRWEASQKIVADFLLTAYEDACQNGVSSKPLPTSYVEGMSRLLKRYEEDPGLLDLLLAPPPQQYLAQFLDDIDPQALDHAYQLFETELSKTLQSEVLEIYQALSQKSLGQAGKDKALRALKNRLLQFIDRDNKSDGLGLVKAQFDNASNMTDSLAALNRLSQTSSSEYQQAKETFRNRWSQDALVMTQFYTVLAQASGPDAFEDIKIAMAAPGFDRENPNNLYSLVRMFAETNWAKFHDSSKHDEIYKWFCDIIIEIDQKNPQVSSRLATSLNIWKQLKTPYRDSLNRELHRILEGSPSKNLYEVISSALA